MITRKLYSYEISFDQETGLIIISQSDYNGDDSDSICIHVDQLEMFTNDIKAEIKG